eukprot:820104-Amphidinium_carterae.1
MFCPCQLAALMWQRPLQRLQVGECRVLSQYHKFIGAMSQLQCLVVLENFFRGTLPNDWLRSLTQLRVLQLGSPEGSAVSYGVSESGESYDITGGMAYGNRFTGAIPHALEGLTSIAKLAISRSGFRGTLPPELLCSLTSLLSVEFFENSLSGTVPLHGYMCAPLLETFNGFHNKLSGSVPTRIPTTIKDYSLGLNDMSGSIVELGIGLTFLTRLSLWGNRFEGALPWHEHMTSIVQYIADTNKFRGSILGSSSSHTSLDYLCIYFNYLSGALPERGLLNTPAIRGMVLMLNSLTGSLPEAGLVAASLLVLVRIADNAL